MTVLEIETGWTSVFNIKGSWDASLTILNLRAFFDENSNQIGLRFAATISGKECDDGDESNPMSVINPVQVCNGGIWTDAFAYWSSLFHQEGALVKFI